MKIKLPSSKVILLVLVGLALLAAIVLVMRRAGPLAPVRVTVTHPTEGVVTPALFGIGIVEARRSYSLGPTSPGRVLRVLVDAGDAVKAGQLLAEMDPVDLEQRLLAFDASLARANSVIAASAAQTADAAARASLATTNAKRYRDLAEQAFVSAGVAEAKVQEQVSAQAGVQAAQSNLSAAHHDLKRLQAERGALVQLRQNLRLVAAQDGVVVSREAEAGATVVAGQAVFKLVDPASLWVKTRFDQGRSAGLVPGLVADIVLRSSADAVRRGKVARVELQSDSVTEERVAQIAFDSLPAGVTMGELAEVTLNLPATASALLLPNAAIKRQGGQTGVWVLDGDRLKFAPVRVGQSSLDGEVQVLEGLQKEQRVVVYSQKDVDTNSRIEIVSNLVPGTP